MARRISVSCTWLIVFKGKPLLRLRSVHAPGIVHTSVDVDSVQEALVLEAADDLSDEGFAEGELVGNLPVGLALLVEALDVEVAGVDVLFRAFLQVLTLRAGAQRAEMGETAFFHNLAGDDVAGAVFKFPVADFDLLDVFEAFVLGGLADGEHAVEEVVETGAAGKVVPGDGAVERTLGRVGDDEKVPVVLVLELLELLHERSGIHALLHIGEEVADVVHHDGVALQLDGGLLDVLEHEVVGFLGHCEHGVDFGPEEAGRETVGLGAVLGGVTELELLVGEFAVDVEDAPAAGNLVGHLDGQDGLAQVGVGKEAADFAFVPEGEVERFRVRALAGVLNGLVGRLDQEHAAFGGVLRFLQDAGYRFERVGCHGAPPTSYGCNGKSPGPQRRYPALPVLRRSFPGP